MPTREEISVRLAALQARALEIEAYPTTRDHEDKVASPGVMPLIKRRIDDLQADVAELLSLQQENDDLLKDIDALLAEANGDQAEFLSTLLHLHGVGEPEKISEVLDELTKLKAVIENLVFLQQTATLLRSSLGSRFDLLSQIAAPVSKIFGVVSAAMTEIKERAGRSSD